MARKKQIEKHDIDYSKYRKIDLPTHYPWCIDKSISDDELAERMAKFNFYIRKTLR